MRSVGLNWQEVKAQLEAQIHAGLWAPGAKLPSEPALCLQMGTRRHSLRRAIGALEQEGKVITLQGKGSFVAALPLLTYRISERTRFSENLRTQGLLSDDEMLEEQSPCRNTAVALRLGLSEDAPLHRTLGRSSISGYPLSLSQTWVCAQTFPDWLAQRQTLKSHSRLLATYGHADYRRQDTTLFARPARAEELSLLHLAPASWVMVSRKLDVALDGTPLVCGESLWAAERIQFTFTDQRTPS